MKKVGRILVVFCMLIAIYVTTMCISYMIPNDYIKENVGISVSRLNGEGDYYNPLFETDASKLDNFTDMLMISKAIKNDDKGALYNSLDVNDYARYWHGYLVLIRPLLIKLDYLQIRYVNVLIFFVLLGITFTMIKKKLGGLMASAFMVSIMMGYAFLVPLSLQFSSVFYIMMISIMFILFLHNRRALYDKLIYIFFIIGSITNFFDLLTAPLLTLGVPLIIVLLLKINDKEDDSFIKNLFTAVFNSIMWAIGYGVTWFSKWVIASIVLKKNVIVDAINNILFRTNGNEEYPVDLAAMFRSNIDLMYNDMIKKVLLIVLVIWIVLFIFYRKRWDKVFKLVAILSVAVLPYIWYFVLSNHSQIHCFFTYRIQIMTTFSVFAFMIMTIDFEKIKNKVL